jgi:hypothetical protein
MRITDSFGEGWRRVMHQNQKLNLTCVILLGVQELRRFPTLSNDIATAANEALDKFRDESKKTVTRLVDMESSYLTAEFFRKIHLEPEKNPNGPPNSNRNAPPNNDNFTDNHLRKIGT